MAADLSYAQLPGADWCRQLRLMASSVTSLEDTNSTVPFSKAMMGRWRDPWPMMVPFSGAVPRSGLTKRTMGPPATVNPMSSASTCASSSSLLSSL